MRQVILVSLLAVSLATYGQSSKWQLSFQLQPELTFHKNQYSFRWKGKYTKQTFNVGLASLIYYNLTDRIFIEGGVSFISRKLTTRAFVNQFFLPPPYYDSILPLYITKSISLRTLQIPLGIGVYIIKRNKTQLFIKAGYVSNLLFNAKYEVNNYPGFKKDYWQGYSLLAGLGMDYELNKKLVLTSAISYSFKNTVKRDFYLFSQDERTIALPHKYLQLSTGIKINFKRN